ncbi:dihydrofolate reductase [Aureibacter tunicatorum]|nr:dihydrofolate reductase [Aureibacter tunicatorum]
MISASMAFVVLQGCQTTENKKDNNMESPQPFEVKADRFADIQVLRYQVPGFEELSLNEKKVLYYLSQAALSGRDIIWDQNFKYNLTIRRLLESIVTTYQGDKSSEEFKNFMTYAKRVWFSNGIHHHYSTNKIQPEFSYEFFLNDLVKNSNQEKFPLEEGQTVESLVDEISPYIFDKSLSAKRVNLDPNKDLVLGSANNYYEEVNAEEAETFYAELKSKASNSDKPVMYGLNSKLIKDNDGQVKEKVYKIDGMYSEAISQIVYWLEKAKETTLDSAQKKSLGLLIDYYRTGDLKTFDEYCIAWVADTVSNIDVVNGFIEVYGDAKGYKAAYESVVSFKDPEASKRMEALAKNAQWFEDQSPILSEHKKKKVKGVSYKVINVVMESGDASPATPIGINLPNSNWIRSEHGSKSVSLGNIKDAYNASSGTGTLEEFCYDDEEISRAQKHSVLAGKLHTALHEVIGHASGQLNPGIGTPKETLKSYASALEEGRADLVGLYFIMDQKLIDIGVMQSMETAKAQYDGYIRNGLMLQLNRLEPGEVIEESHMRNRQLVAKWAYEKGLEDNVIEKKSKNGKTYFVINDYEKLRGLFGQLLTELQRIKSEGDYEAGKNLIETYGVQVDENIYNEVKQRYASLDNAPYSGFIQPRLVPTMEDGEITDVTIEYPKSFVDQMLEYGEKYSFLPNKN